MTVRQAAALLGAQILTPGVGEEKEALCGYACDLLSWVMSHGAAGTAWITVMTHMNVIAVATLLDFACVIVPEGIAVDGPILDKAAEEGICVLSSDKTAFELCGLLYGAGVGPAARG